MKSLLRRTDEKLDILYKTKTELEEKVRTYLQRAQHAETAFDEAQIVIEDLKTEKEVAIEFAKEGVTWWETAKKLLFLTVRADIILALFNYVKQRVSKRHTDKNT